MSLSARWRALRPGIAVGSATNNHDFWGITFGRPSAFLVLVAIADIKWITPNILTHISNVFFLVGSLFILYDEHWAFIAAAVLINVALTFDCADGQLARYRQHSSALGAYYDKVTDVYSYLIMYPIIAWVCYQRTGESYYYLLAMGAACSRLVIGYLKWLVTDLFKSFATTRKVPGTGPMPGGWRFVVRMFLKIFEFRQPDMQLWLGLGLAINYPEVGLWIMGTTQTAIAVGTGIYYAYDINATMKGKRR